MSEWDWVKAQPKGRLNNVYPKQRLPATSADPEPPLPHEHPCGTPWVRLSATFAMFWRTNPVFGLRYSQKRTRDARAPSRPSRLTFPRQNP